MSDLFNTRVLTGWQLAHTYTALQVTIIVYTYRIDFLKNTFTKSYLPRFSGSMWAGVLLSLFIVGTVFYMISCLHAILMHRRSRRTQRMLNWSEWRSKGLLRPSRSIDTKLFRDVQFRRYLGQIKSLPLKNTDLFDDYSNCLLFTYSMLMYVSLPRLPRTWSLRVLTGWYWLYCILLTVIYRASLTAILANPAER